MINTRDGGPRRGCSVGSVAAAKGRQLALLRGVNVGKHRQLPMAELRQLLERLGLSDVATHLRSGNVVYTTAKTPRCGEG